MLIQSIFCILPLCQLYHIPSNLYKSESYQLSIFISSYPQIIIMQSILQNTCILSIISLFNPYFILTLPFLNPYSIPISYLPSCPLSYPYIPSIFHIYPICCPPYPNPFPIITDNNIPSHVYIFNPVIFAIHIALA